MTAKPGGDNKPGSKPTVSDRIERARAAAAPKLEKAAADAAPRVEKAAQAAGSFLGTLRERAKETARQFNEGLSGEDAPAKPKGEETPPDRPRPRPGPR